MKTVVKSSAVDLSLRSLDPEGMRKVQQWFDYLARWDENVRRDSLSLPGHPGVFILRTPTDIRIFFRIDGDIITVLDVARESAIVASGSVRVGSSGAISIDAVKVKGE